MKIKATKNTIKQVEGTNSFEVQTVGERMDLEELRNKLKSNGFTFAPNGELRDSYKRFNELIDHANKIEDVYKRDEAMERIHIIQESLDNYTELYIWLNNKTYEYIYTLDMNNIEIVTEEDEEGKMTAKAIINIVEDKDTDQLLFWEELLGDYNKN